MFNMKKFPRRLVSVFYGAENRVATLWLNLATREYLVEREADGVSKIYNSRYNNVFDAEDAAEDWVMQQ